MSKFISENPKIALGVSIGVGVAAVGLTVWIKNKLDNTPPTKWRRVGEISDLICYPIKSCGQIRVKEIQCSKIGLEDNHLRDRVFMVIETQTGEFITGRKHPKLVQIIPKVEGDTMTLSAPGMIDIDLDVKRLHSQPTLKAGVWGENVDAVDCGEEMAKWLSRFVISEDTGLRLVFYPKSYPTRDVREKNKSFATMIRSDAGALHDATSFMLVNESSVAELNTRLDTLVTPLRFRPNFVVKGPGAYEEDNWKWIRIGESTIFRNVKPCTRCVFTNVDPETGIRDMEEPLKTLKTYRKAPGCGESPVLGIHMGLRGEGTVALGDIVYVA